MATSLDPIVVPHGRTRPLLPPLPPPRRTRLAVARLRVTCAAMTRALSGERR